MDDNTRQEIALFRYGLIADLAHRAPRERGLAALLREKADRDYEIPGSRRRHVAAETLRDWLTAYRGGGFDALLPKPRSDQGQSRALPPEIADRICALKEAQPALSIPKLVAHARLTGAVPPELPLALATVHRLLCSRDLARSPSAPASSDRRRFAFEKANEMWMSDVMHGPAVLDPSGKKRKSYLIALLDDSTRVVPYAAFALSENTQAFLPVFEQAIRRRGIPQRLYVDNGAAYRSHHLALVCAKLGVALIHARPYQPQAKGKQERWFRTVRMQLLSRLPPEPQPLDALNRLLWAYVEGEYHHSPHRGLDGDTPSDRWARSAHALRLPDAGLADLFLFEARRRVHKDRTVSLGGVVFEVDASLVGQTVTLRFDPSKPRGPIDVLLDHKLVHQAKPVDAYVNCFVRRDHQTKALAPSDPAAPPPAGLRLSDLKKKG